MWGFLSWSHNLHTSGSVERSRVALYCIFRSLNTTCSFLDVWESFVKIGRAFDNSRGCFWYFPMLAYNSVMRAFTDHWKNISQLQISFLQRVCSKLIFHQTSPKPGMQKMTCKFLQTVLLQTTLRMLCVWRLIWPSSDMTGTHFCVSGNAPIHGNAVTWIGNARTLSGNATPKVGTP